VVLYVIEVMEHKSWGSRPILLPASCDAGKNNCCIVHIISRKKPFLRKSSFTILCT
jgi:hypothetical protein